MRHLACTATIGLMMLTATLTAAAQVAAPESAASAAGYVRKDVNVTYVAKQDGFVVVKLLAAQGWRTVYAAGVVDGDPIAVGSAADNAVDGVISTPQDTFTFPVRRYSYWSVASTTGVEGVEVRWFQFAK